MRIAWIALISLFLFAFATQANAVDERKDPKKSQPPRAAATKAKPRMKAESKAKAEARDTEKRPPDPLEKGAGKVRSKENPKDKMPPDDFRKREQMK